MNRSLHCTLLAAGALSLAATGCNRNTAPPAPAKPAGPPQVAADILAKFKPNETGAVLVVMYHDFRATGPDTDLNRRPDTFRKDLQTFFDQGYWPVNASDFVAHKMDVPAGKTPIVLTFDDAKPSQFRTIIKSDGNTGIDPDCAVGIMETFAKGHTPWPLKGTFFILPKEGKNPDPFTQDSFPSKLKYLVDKGYEIANHTSTHSNMRGMKADKVQWELATASRDIKALQPNATMEILALPYGVEPRDEAARKALLSGTDGGTQYNNKAVFRANWRPVLSAITKADLKAPGRIHFDPAGIERVAPDARHPKTPGTLEYWLNYFKNSPTQRYISDGDLQVAAVPEAARSNVDPARAKALGLTVQFYGGAGGAGGKAGGGDLSVN